MKARVSAVQYQSRGWAARRYLVIPFSAPMVGPERSTKKHSQTSTLFWTT